MNNFKLRTTVAALAGITLFGLTGIAKADSTDDLLKKLRDKGVLTEQEYDEFNATRDTEKIKKTSEIKASFKDGIVWKSGDGATQMSINGRIQADYRTFDVPSHSAAGALKTDATNVPDTFDIRRSYITVKGTFFNNINFEATRDANDVKYYWLEAAYVEQAKVRFGQFKMPFGLEQLTSSRFTDFTERDFVAYMAPGVDRGIMVHGVPMKGLSYALSVGNGSVIADAGQNAREASNGHDGKEWTARATANIAQLASIQDMILHVGADYNTGNDDPLGAGAIKFRTNARGTEFFKTGVDYLGGDIRRYDLEALASYGPVKFQAEYANTQIDPTLAGASKKDIKAWYAGVNWLITGESYADAYKDGVMDRLRPKNDFITFGAPGWGAWEVGARYSNFDAKDFKLGTAAQVTAKTADIDTAKYSNDIHSWTAGLKWIPNPNTRFVLDYIKTDFDTAINGGATVKPYDSEKSINFRAQFDF